MAEITITDLSRHEGIIAFGEREAKIIESQHFHLHVVDLEKFETSFTNLKYTLHQFERQNMTKPYHKTLDIRMQQLYDNYYRLKPIHRRKRGLFNPLGSFIKSVTGNLDDHDLQLIKETIEVSRVKTNSIIDNSNKQITINKNFETKINDIVKHVNEHQIEILRKISKIIDKVNDPADNHLKGIVHELFFNIDMLNNQLRDIFEIVQLSKLGILSKAILNNDETKFILKFLEQQNISVSNIDQIYEFLSVETHHEHSLIIFVIKIPIFMAGHFQYVKLETIPSNNKIIFSKFNLIILGNNLTFGINNDCIVIEDYRVCRREQLTNITGDGCIDNALRGINASCMYERYRDEMDIKPIDEHTLVIRNAIQPITLDSNCNIKTRKVTGTLLITFPNCSIFINGAKYDDTKTLDHHEIRLIPTIGVDFHATTTLDEPDLQELNLLRIENRNHIDKLREDHSTFQHTMTGFLVFLTITITGLMIASMRRKLNTIWKQLTPKGLLSKVNPCENQKTSSLSADQEQTVVHHMSETASQVPTEAQCSICHPDSGRIFPKGGRS